MFILKIFNAYEISSIVYFAVLNVFLTLAISQWTVTFKVTQIDRISIINQIHVQEKQEFCV